MTVTRKLTVEMAEQVALLLRAGHSTAGAARILGLHAGTLHLAYRRGFAPTALEPDQIIAAAWHDTQTAARERREATRQQVGV